MAKVELHYLDCRGRGQAVRGILSDAGIQFHDLRYTIDNLREAWPLIAADSEKSGPFSSVPVLQWDRFQLAQLLPVLSFVDAKLGYLQGKTAEQIAHQQMVASAAYLDITGPLALMLWQPIVHAGTEMTATIEGTATRVGTKLRQLEALWARREQASGAYWWGTQPTSADFVMFEAWHTARMILQGKLNTVCGECPQLAELEAALRGRAAFAECEAKAPKQQCASPVEMKVREMIRTSD